MCRVLVGVALVVLPNTLCFESQGPEEKRVRRQEAVELVMRVLPQRTAEARGLELQEISDRYFPDFYFFEVLWKQPGPGSVVAGHYAVDQRTGDVWDPLLCKPITSLALQRLQHRIRKRIGLSNVQYEQLRRQAPCSPETPAKGEHQHR